MSDDELAIAQRRLNDAVGAWLAARVAIAEARARREMEAAYRDLRRLEEPPPPAAA